MKKSKNTLIVGHADIANAQAEITSGNDGVQGIEVLSDKAEINHFANVILVGKSKKLSPKTVNHVLYEIALHDVDSELYIRLSDNEGGGLHSKEWIKLDDLFTVLDDQSDKPFKSTVLKSVFKGSSANNAGFLAACLRGLLLINPTDKSVFLHVLAPEYAQRRAELLSLVDDSDTSVS